MATSAKQETFRLASEDLKQKYQHQKIRIKSMCKAIADTTQTHVSVEMFPNGEIRVEVIGHRLKKAIEYIVDEFCKKPVAEKLSREFKLARGQPKVGLAQEALQILSVKDQENLIKEGTEYLLTQEALRKHDILTGVLELRQFACETCDRYWWRTVSRTKAVARCYKCHVKYDALPRDKEFGTGRYRCTICGHLFYCRCEATTEQTCFNCHSTVRAPYIHPKFKQPHRTRQPVNPNTVPYQPPPPRGAGVATMHQQNVVNASQRHDSTGSTASTFITQVPYYTPEPEDQSYEEIPSDISDSECYEEENDSSTDVESDSELSSIKIAHDSDNECSTSDVESTVGKRGSSSDFDSDSDESPQQHTHIPSDELQSVSLSSSAKDSGLGTTEVASSTEKRSDGSNVLQEIGSVPPGSIADYNPTDFPGVTFSKHCAKKDVDDTGDTIVGEGIKLVVPENALESGDKITVELQACLSGRFVLPDNMVLVSPVYRIAPPCVFHRDVTLTIEHFALLERDTDCNDIVFISSPSKPKISEDQAYWKFHVLAAPECRPRSQHGKIKVDHFCLGALAQRLRRGQRYLYCSSWNLPLSYTPPRCHAVFSVTLHHTVYIENLRRYLEKTFNNQRFLPVNKIFSSTESDIELKIPTDTPGYKVTTNMGNQIQKEEVDYALNYKKRAQSDFSTYPPRIVIAVRQLDPHSDLPLDCIIPVSGIRTLPNIELHVSPPSASDTSSQRSPEDIFLNEEQARLQMNDLRDVSDYLTDLTNEQCVSLGLVFGLHYPKLERMTDYPNEVVAAWLRQEDDVLNRCSPTWRNLSTALRSIGQNGLSERVRRDHS